MAMTYLIESLVRVEISNDDGDFPMCPTDPTNVLSRFHQYTGENKIYPCCRGGVSGGGMYVGFYTEEDAEKIQTFLESIGVKERLTPHKEGV